jgi:hypothetical protein
MHRYSTYAVCQTCGVSFGTFPSHVARGGGKFCSPACQSEARRIPLVDRFWARVQKGDGCWLWTGRLNDAGYGVIDRGGHTRNGGRPLLAHRVSWEFEEGPIPAKLFVCHNCDAYYPPGDITYRRCVKRAHLWLGTNADNAQDMATKGRSQRGERHSAAKWTDAQVAEARARWAVGGIMQKDLAGAYGVSRGTMSQILSGQLHVTTVRN